jgi:excisionase family DNA binding protein
MTESKLFGDLLTPDEAADALAVSSATMRRWLREGVIPGHKIGRQWRVHADVLREFLFDMISQSKTSEPPSGELLESVEASPIHCPVCAANALQDFGGEGESEYRCDACGAVFTIKEGPPDVEFRSLQRAERKARKAPQPPAIYEKSPKRQEWYKTGFLDAQDGKEITDQFLVDLTMRLGTGITGAYQHGYEDGLKMKYSGEVVEES